MVSKFLSILIPAILAAGLYTFSTFVLYPLWRAHRQRYANYLPVPLHSLDLERLSSRTTGLRHSISRALIATFIPASMRDRWRSSSSSSDAGSAGGRGSEDDDDDDGHVDVEFELGRDALVLAAIDQRRREALEQRRRTLERRQGDAAATAGMGRDMGTGGRDAQQFSDHRLGRELEEGFMDSSDEEDAGEVEGRGDRAARERWRTTS